MRCVGYLKSWISYTSAIFKRNQTMQVTIHFKNKPPKKQPATTNIEKQLYRKTCPKSLIISRPGKQYWLYSVSSADPILASPVQWANRLAPIQHKSAITPFESLHTAPVQTGLTQTSCIYETKRMVNQVTHRQPLTFLCTYNNTIFTV